MTECPTQVPSFQRDSDLRSRSYVNTTAKCPGDLQETKMLPGAAGLRALRDGRTAQRHPHGTLERTSHCVWVSCCNAPGRRMFSLVHISAIGYWILQVQLGWYHSSDGLRCLLGSQLIWGLHGAQPGPQHLWLGCGWREQTHSGLWCYLSRCLPCLAQDQCWYLAVVQHGNFRGGQAASSERKDKRNRDSKLHGLGTGRKL